jgi:hypothetical protein
LLDRCRAKKQHLAATLFQPVLPCYTFGIKTNIDGLIRIFRLSRQCALEEAAQDTFLGDVLQAWLFVERKGFERNQDKVRCNKVHLSCRGSIETLSACVWIWCRVFRTMEGMRHGRHNSFLFTFGDCPVLSIFATLLVSFAFNVSIRGISCACMLHVLL